MLNTPNILNTATNHHQQSIQLLPIGDLNMLEIFPTTNLVPPSNVNPIVIGPVFNKKTYEIKNVMHINTESVNRIDSPSSSNKNNNLVPQIILNKKKLQSIVVSKPPEVAALVKSLSMSSGTNIEDMSLSVLKEECRRRKLLVTGNKQKLIDRIRASSVSLLTSQVNGVKSPDSGVNMDSSPSFTSSKHYKLIFL